VKAIRERLNDFDLLLSPSQAAAVKVRGLTDIPVLVLNEGFDPDLFQPIERDFSNEITFIYIGSADDRNGTWIIPEAFRIAFPSEKDVRLLIYTGGWGNISPVRIRAGSDERIEIDTQAYDHTDVPKLLSRGHIFVHLALSPTWTLTVPEAMATGMPCIVTRAGSFTEYFSAEYGWFVEFGDTYIDAMSRKMGLGYWRVPNVSDVAAKMRYAYEHRDELEAKGKAAAEYAHRHLTFHASLERFLPILRAVWNGEVKLEDLRRYPIAAYGSGVML